MRILVTGASGFAGRHVGDYFLRAKGQHWVYLHVGRTYSDLGDQRTSWALPEDIDVLIHTAAISAAPGVPDSEVARNVQITQNLASYAMSRGRVKKIIFFSSLSYYGDVLALDHVLRENSPRINPSVYGETKHICEEVLRETGIPTVVLRLPAVLGLGVRRHWPARVMEAGKLGQEVVVHNPNRPYNNVVHIDYLCELIEVLIGSGWPSVFLPLLPASKQPITTREVVNILVRDRSLIQETADVRSNFTIDTGTLDQILPLWSTDKTVRQYVEDEKNV